MAKLIMPDPRASNSCRRRPCAPHDDEERPANLIMAAAQGAQTGVKLAVAVGAMVLAFVALVALANGILGWAGGLIGFEGVTFEGLLGYVFAPVFRLLGAPDWAEAMTRGRTVRHQAGAQRIRRLHRTGPGAGLSPRTVAVVTFALCGFANFSSIAIQMAVTGGLAPNQRPMIAQAGDQGDAGGEPVQPDERGAGGAVPEPLESFPPGWKGSSEARAKFVQHPVFLLDPAEPPVARVGDHRRIGSGRMGVGDEVCGIERIESASGTAVSLRAEFELGKRDGRDRPRFAARRGTGAGGHQRLRAGTAAPRISATRPAPGRASGRVSRGCHGSPAAGARGRCGVCGTAGAAVPLTRSASRSASEGYSPRVRRRTSISGRHSRSGRQRWQRTLSCLSTLQEAASPVFAALARLTGRGGSTSGASLSGPCRLRRASGVLPSGSFRTADCRGTSCSQ